MNKKQTAVDFLVEKFSKYYSIHQLEDEIEQAKAMEKQQIIDAFEYGVADGVNLIICYQMCKENERKTN